MSGGGDGMESRRSIFLSAHFDAIAHATEDIQKVEQAIRSLIQLVIVGNVNLTRRYLKGHYGNMIATISAKLSAKELSSDPLRALSRQLTESDRRFLSENMKSCIDEDGNLYLRFDKQEAFMGKVRLHQGDPIRMKLKFASTRNSETILKACRESGLIL